MSKTKYEVVEIDHADITVDVSLLGKSEAMYFNATEMAKCFDKIPYEWLRKPEAKEYIDALSESENLRNTELIITRQGGKYRGTWLHNDLAIVFARWLDACFAVQMDLQVKRMLTEEHARAQARLAARTGYLPLTNAVRDAHGDPQFFHYSTEADLINRAVVGMSAKKFRNLHEVDDVRDAMTVEELQRLDKVQRQNTSLVELGFDYKERKSMLSRSVEAA